MVALHIITLLINVLHPLTLGGDNIRHHMSVLMASHPSKLFTSIGIPTLLCLNVPTSVIFLFSSCSAKSIEVYKLSVVKFLPCKSWFSLTLSTSLRVISYSSSYPPPQQVFQQIIQIYV